MGDTVGNLRQTAYGRLRATAPSTSDRRRAICSRARRAFTLVELLVVIGIIGLLAALLMPVLGRASEFARRSTCASNVAQIYAAARQYSLYFDEYLPNLYNGVPPSDQPDRYRESYRCIVEDESNEELMPAGLLLLEDLDYAESDELFFCPSLPGAYRPGGSENPMDEEEDFETIGYAYNCWPARGVPAPPSLGGGRISNNFGRARVRGFSALMADRFENSGLLPHQAISRMTVGYWDGSVQALALDDYEIPWNAPPDEDGSRKFDGAVGTIGVRDTWTSLSSRRR